LSLKDKRQPVVLQVLSHIACWYLRVSGEGREWQHYKCFR